MANVRIVVYNNDLPQEVTNRDIRINVNLQDYFIKEGEETVVPEAVKHALTDAVAVDYTQRRAADGTLQLFQRNIARYIVQDLGPKNMSGMTNANKRIESSIVKAKGKAQKPIELVDITSENDDVIVEDEIIEEENNEL